jgi:ATP-dependent DNA helicase RecG
LGRSQSGGKSHLRLLRVLRDEELIDRAKEMANKILSIDPKLNKLPELRDEIEKLRIDEAARFMDKS